MIIIDTVRRYAPHLFVAGVLVVGITAAARADSDLAAYQAAVPALEQAGGGKACVACFLERYAPAEQPKAFAVSKDGAYGARWKKSLRPPMRIRHLLKPLVAALNIHHLMVASEKAGFSSAN